MADLGKEQRDDEVGLQGAATREEPASLTDDRAIAAGKKLSDIPGICFNRLD
jgi:hypothetical protein